MTKKRDSQFDLNLPEPKPTPKKALKNPSPPPIKAEAGASIHSFSEKKNEVEKGKTANHIEKILSLVKHFN
ncbi:MAG: hypothetical protein ISR48_05750 [Alphaproteobacteria bacterium]|nr:hypothetical protein [Alphaproteobacteria bacterium]